MTAARRGAAGALLASGLIWVLLEGPAAGTSAPPGWALDGVQSWYDQVGPAVVLAALARAVAMAMAVWLLAACLVEAAAALRSLAWLRPLADLVAPRALQHLVRGVAGVTAMAGVAVAAAPPPLADPASVVVMQQLDDSGDPPPQIATMTPLDAAPTAPSVPATEPVADPADGAIVVVEPGESLWSIAAARLAELTGGSPSEQEVAPYWHRLVELNRDRLVVPDNADLIYPGQELRLPPL
jgi:hypothetical protein